MLCKVLLEAAREFATEPMTDDVAILAIRRRPRLAVDAELSKRTERALAGNLHNAGREARRQGKLFVRDRLALLLDEGSFVEDGLFANVAADDLPADGVVTGVGRGRPARGAWWPTTPP